jgi:alpha-tubulin suppressor-like RCC1 family protein
LAQGGIVCRGDYVFDSAWSSGSFAELDVGQVHILARRPDGSVVAWGGNIRRQCVVPPLPAGLSYVEISAGDDHSVARRSDGSVVAWGNNFGGQCNVPALPAG